MNPIIRYQEEKNRAHKLTFEQLDEIPYIDENGNHVDHKNSERDEQIIAKEYILPTDTVLELGGRYGTVSCIINNILDDPTKHIVIEPDDTVISALLNNRTTHNSFFTVYQNIICKKPKKLIYDGLSTRTEDIMDEPKMPIPSISLQEIMDVHSFGFTALVADCEGCLEDFVVNHKELIKQLRYITYEQDCPHLSNYTIVGETLTECGLTHIKGEFHSVWIRE
jgi:hypothetical protein